MGWRIKTLGEGWFIEEWCVYDLMKLTGDKEKQCKNARYLSNILLQNGRGNHADNEAKNKLEQIAILLGSKSSVSVLATNKKVIESHTHTLTHYKREREREDGEEWEAEECAKSSFICSMKGKWWANKGKTQHMQAHGIKGPPIDIVDA